MEQVKRAARAVEEKPEKPPLCAWIQQTREHLKDQWAAESGGARGNPFTQEAVAQRIGVTLKAYNLWENKREPKPRRLREIATALGLTDDYFLPTVDLASATARVVAEAERLKTAGDEIEDLLGALRVLVEGAEPAPSQDAHS